MSSNSKKGISGASMMGYGALSIVIGLIITGISYAATPDGGYYTVFTSLIIGGIIYFVLGFFKMLAGR